jgi:NCAIR mutase (PurE)-related protein
VMKGGKKMRYNFVEPDLERCKRQNFPEAIYCPGKSKDEIIKIIEIFLEGNVSPIILTRMDKILFTEIKEHFPQMVYHERARLGSIVSKRGGRRLRGNVCVVSAGTADVSVAEEAAVTLELLGNKVTRIYDIGVSGIHRVFKHLSEMRRARCIIVCAGMEGALPGVIAGLVDKVVIGVPVSVGYGVALGGFSALFTILASCSANLVSVNIDDGYGAAIVAHLINNIPKRSKC